MMIRTSLTRAALYATACSIHVLSPSIATAATPAIATDSAVFVERKPTEAKRRLEPASKLLLSRDDQGEKARQSR